MYEEVIGLLRAEAERIIPPSYFKRGIIKQLCAGMKIIKIRRNLLFIICGDGLGVSKRAACILHERYGLQSPGS